MSINNSGNNISRYINGLVSLFSKKDDSVSEIAVSEIIKEEINNLWKLVRQRNEGLCTDETCKTMISVSFNNVKERFSRDEIDSAHTWPRYVKVAVNCMEDPVEELVAYINEDNYIRLSKCLTDLSRSMHKREDIKIRNNMEKFAEAVYLHVIHNIDHKDIPSCLYLGKMYQKRAEYATAREWFGNILETDAPFKGFTAIQTCYEDEKKALLLGEKSKYAISSEVKEKVEALNERQCSLYEKYYQIAREHINRSDEASELRYRREFVSLVTRYARFEKNRGDFSKAFSILEEVPGYYPDMYRVYAEEAMIYQFKSHMNCYYSLDMAIESFKRAAHAISINETDDTVSAKSKKSILIPLANTYFQAERYAEATSVCDKVLRIDSNEQRAIKLKNRIALLSA